MGTKNIIKLFQPRLKGLDLSLCFLLIRIVAGVAFMLHGWTKIQNPFEWMGPEASTPAFLQFLAAISEFGGGIAWILGLLTPLASFGIASTMVVATSKVMMMNAPFISKTGGISYELSAVYFCIAILFLIMGPGKISLDYLIFRDRNGTNALL